MRHNIAHRKLGRTTSHRMALFRNMLSELVRRDRIETSLAKARELRPLADRLVTLGKEGTISARRRAASLMCDDIALKKLFSGLVGRFSDRKGGYTRIMKLGFRHGDSAPMAVIEYLTAEVTAPAKKVEKKPKKEPKKKS